jgi:hypothetical protein
VGAARAGRDPEPGGHFRPGLTAGISAQGASSTDPEVAAPTRVVPHWGLSAAAKVQRTWLRFDARHSLDTSDPRHPAHHVVTTLGLEWLPAPAEPDPVVEVPPPPPAPTPAPTFTVSPAGQVWVSHPLCAWVSAADAPALIATAPHPVTVVAPGYRPVVIDPASPRDLVLEPAAHGGAVVVAAAPGDHVFVDDTPVPVGPDGVALVNTPNALVAVRIEGGGRQVDVELAPADGWGVWYPRLRHAGGRGPVPPGLGHAGARGAGHRVPARGPRRRPPVPPAGQLLAGR